MKLEAIVLAAGHGTRMKSRVPKVLHQVGGQPMLRRVLDTVTSLAPSRIHVVVGRDWAAYETDFQDADLNWVLQAQQLGTGHAVLHALPSLVDDPKVLVIYGDCPLVTAEILYRCVNAGRGGVGLITAVVPDPKGLGRIIRSGKNEVEAIIEHRDISPAQCSINEINSGILCASAAFLRRYLPRLSDDNAQGEFYLTDLIEVATANDIKVNAVQAIDYREVLGVNDRAQLAQVERVFQRRQAEQLMRQGVTIMDPARFDCRGKVATGLDCLIDINVVLEGEIELGDNVQIGANCVLRNVQIASDTVIKENSIIEDATVGQHCSIGPFARIRPGSTLSDDVSIGNFVEIKNSYLADGVKAGHLAYLGDADVGSSTNIGAGAITCNFDGKNKHRTVIGNDVFIGTNSSLIAPVTVESGAFIAAGSAISRKVDADDFAIERSEQRNVSGGAARFRKR